jgi:hypothetical protein
MDKLTSLQASIRIKNDLNKLDSKDYQNIPLWKMEEAVNTAALRFCRRRIDAKETNNKLVEDLQVLLKGPVRLVGVDKDIFFLSHKLPTDYFASSSVAPICEKGECSGVRMGSELVEDANVNDLLQDYSSQPSFDFEQTFHVIAGDKIRQYHNRDFKIKELELTYYRQPQYITFPNTPQIDGSLGKDMTWEFKKDICDLIIEEAVEILAENTENINRAQVAQNNLQKTK